MWIVQNRPLNHARLHGNVDLRALPNWRTNGVRICGCDCQINDSHAASQGISVIALKSWQGHERKVWTFTEHLLTFSISLLLLQAKFMPTNKHAIAYLNRDGKVFKDYPQCF